MTILLRTKVNAIIKANGWTATKLANELDMTEPMLSRIRSGTTVKVDWPTGQRIIEVWHAVTGTPTHKQLLTDEEKKAVKLRKQLRRNNLTPTA